MASVPALFDSKRQIVLPDDYAINPLDSVMLSAIIYEYGGLIEAKRVPVQEQRVFSYRFAPENDGTLYSRADSWKDFWMASLQKAETSGCIACLDISDFYNQICAYRLKSAGHKMKRQRERVWEKAG